MKSIKKLLEEYPNEIASILTGEYLYLTMSDFFNVASSYSVLIYTDDLLWIVPIYKKYGNDGLNACIAYIEKLQPLNFYQNEKYLEAYKEIENLNPEVTS